MAWEFSAMTHSKMTRWIEDADARECYETARFDRGASVAETHYLDLGAKIASLPSWLWRSVSREPQAAVACPAVVYIRDRQPHAAR
jgi:hypothetical protein